jgi:primosomal protein N' (replication factor Y)
VIVQTFNPAHYAIATAKDHDFRSFFEKEVALREQLGYPPFSHLACLRLQGNNAAVTCAMAERLGRGMKGILQGWPKKGKDIQVLGPVEAPVAKLKGKYRWQILVKSRGSRLLHYFLSEMDGFARKMLKSSGVNLIMDLDPYQML